MKKNETTPATSPAPEQPQTDGKYQCGSCEMFFDKPDEDACPHCGSGNWVEGCIDEPEQPQGQHTPGEWKFKQTRGNNIYEHRIYSGMTTIADLDGENAAEVKANAARIVQCVNGYDELKREHEYMVGQDQKKQALINELVEALRAVYQDIELNNVKGGSDELNVMVQNALAKATQKH